MRAVADQGIPATAADPRQRWSFGNAVLDGRSLRLYVGGRAVELEMKPLEVLRNLLQHAGEAISKDDLLKAVWPGRILSDSVLTNTMAKLREALGDDGQSIKTVHGFGYRLDAEVRTAADTGATNDWAPAGSAAPAAAAREPPSPRTPSRRVAALAAGLLVVIAAAALWRLQGARGPLSADKSIAVLPFANTSGDPANDYFSDGLSDEIIAALGQSPDLKVIGRTSSFQFRNTAEGSRAIGEKLGVAFLLEGSVRKADDRVRIAVHLVKASDGATLWSETYDRELKDILAVQGEIAAAVAGWLDVILGKVASLPSVNIEAYEEVLRGDFQRNQSGTAYRKAVGHYERAIALDPGYATAHARLATAIVYLVYLDTRLDAGALRQLVSRARAASDAAVKLDPSLAEAHLARAGVLTQELDYAGARAAAERAVELAPQYTNSVAALGIMRDVFGRFDEAIALHQRSVEINPLVPPPRVYLALALRAAGRYEEAEAAQRKAVEIRPQGSGNHAYLAAIQILRGNTGAALETAQLEADEMLRFWALAMAHAARSDRAAADAALQRLIGGAGAGMAYQVAEVHALRQEPDRMFEWLDRAVANRDASVGRLLGNPFFAPYRKDPRFVALAQKIGVLPKPGGPGVLTAP